MQRLLIHFIVCDTCPTMKVYVYVHLYVDWNVWETKDRSAFVNRGLYRMIESIG
jgi:hypothetical protein